MRHFKLLPTSHDDALIRLRTAIVKKTPETPLKVTSKPNSTYHTSKDLSDDYLVYLLACPAAHHLFAVVHELSKAMRNKGVINMPTFFKSPFLGSRKGPPGTNVLAIISGKDGKKPPSVPTIMHNNKFSQDIHVHEWAQEGFVKDIIKPFLDEIIKALQLKN